MCQMDILSPLTVFDPGTFKNLRDRLVKVFESGVLVFAYSVTYLVNCEVKKLHGRSGIPEEITRLTADGLSNNQVESLNVQYHIYAQNEIIFISCPVGGRNVLGYVGEKIKFLLEDGVLKQQLDMHGSDTGNTEEQFNSVSQVTYNVTR